MAIPEQVETEIQKIFQSLDRDRQIVTAWEQALKVLKQHDLAWSQLMRCDFVGVHPCNRGGLGLQGAEVHQLGLAHCSAGYSWDMASRGATAVQSPPAPEDAEAAQFNQLMVDLDDGRWFPAVTQLALLSIGGGHSNAFLRAIKGGCPTPHSELADSDGVLDAGHLATTRPGLAKALEQGLEWTVLHWRVAAAYPRLIDVGQAALNTKPSSDVSELEVLLTLREAAKLDIARGRPINWDRCRAEAARSQPKCASYMTALANFVSLGASELLEELSTFKGAFSASAGASLGPAFWEKAAQLKWPGITQYPLVRAAVVKANVAAPITKIEHGVCKLLPPSDVDKLLNKPFATSVRQSEGVLEQARAMCDKHLHDPSHRVKLLGQLDCRVIYFLLKKGKQSLEAREYTSLAQIGKALCMHARNAVAYDCARTAAASAFTMPLRMRQP
jgi:hypothetical protein